jgi:hypothetical protein
MGDGEIRAARELLITVVKLSPNRAATIDQFGAGVSDAGSTLAATEKRSESASQALAARKRLPHDLLRAKQFSQGIFRQFLKCPL